MKNLSFIFLPLLALAAGCGDDTTGAGGSGGAGSGGATATSTTSASTSTTAASTGSGEGGEAASTTTGTGGGDGTGGSGTGGGVEAITPACTDVIAPEVSPSAGSCVDMEVAACNPVTNEGCGEGEQCDIGENPAEYECYTLGTEACGTECDDISLFCVTGQSCTLYFPEAYPEADFVCARYCCSDDDCNGGTCVPNGQGDIHPGLGYCFE